MKQCWGGSIGGGYLHLRSSLGGFKYRWWLQIQVILTSSHSHLNGYDDNDFCRQGSITLGNTWKDCSKEELWRPFTRASCRLNQGTYRSRDTALLSQTAVRRPAVKFDLCGKGIHNPFPCKFFFSSFIVDISALQDLTQTHVFITRTTEEYELSVLVVTWYLFAYSAIDKGLKKIQRILSFGS